MSQISTWVQAMRLRTLPLSLSGILVGSGIAYMNNYWNSLIFVLAIATTISFQVLSNFANDLGDSLKGTDNKNRVGPTRAVQSGKLTVNNMKFGVVVTSIISFISAAFLIYFGTKAMTLNFVLIYAGLAILCIIAAITYTLGKKAYGYHGMGDLMVFLFFGGVSVLGVYSLYSKGFDIANVLPAITIGLLSTAVLNLNNMRDYQNDKASNKNTLVVRMGPDIAKFYHTLLILMALMSFVIYLFRLNDKFYFLAIIPFGYLLYHQRKVMATTRVQDFDPELKKVALSTFAVSILFLVVAILRTNAIN